MKKKKESLSEFFHTKGKDTKHSIVINGQQLPFKFYTDNFITQSLIMNPKEYGLLTVIKKKEGAPEGEVIATNVAITLTNEPYGGEKYVVGSKTYEKFCKFEELQELKTSPVVKKQKKRTSSYSWPAHRDFKMFHGR